MSKRRPTQTVRVPLTDLPLLEALRDRYNLPNIGAVITLILENQIKLDPDTEPEK